METEEANKQMLQIGHGKCHDGERCVLVFCENARDASITEDFLEEATVDLSLDEAICFSD